MASKIERRETYVRGTEASNKEQIVDTINKSTKILAHEQTWYEDGSYSLKVTIVIPKQ